jgi:hypothetical protein
VSRSENVRFHQIGQRIRGSHDLHDSIPEHPKNRTQQGTSCGVHAPIKFRLVQVACASPRVPRKLEGEPADHDDRRSHAACS